MARRVQLAWTNTLHEVGAVRENWYFVGNSRTGECSDAVARSAAAACDRLGWDRSECVVILVGTPPTSRRATYCMRGPLPGLAEAPRYLC
ncbi:hypothetical protein L6Q96_03525 [Candidatus Binatia bacterium]|nr:hypothetical protein [Candidatus Binatia bacterium]